MDLIETVRKLNRIGINLNQLAWDVHSLNFIDTKAYWENVEMANADCVIARNRLGQAMPPDHCDPGALVRLRRGSTDDGRIFCPRLGRTHSR
jgi:hypothetical protein